MNRLFRRIGIGAMLGVIGMALVACDNNQPTATIPAPTATVQLTTDSTSTAVPDVSGSIATSTPGADEAATGQVTATATTKTAATADEQAAFTKLNLNEVTEAELMATIPNFPTRMVREFQEYRPYASIQQFRKEIGKYVDQAQVAEWEQYVYVPVDPNASDEESLMQLPGVDEGTAASLVSARPYASNAAFLEELAKYVDGVQATQAANYLAGE